MARGRVGKAKTAKAAKRAAPRRAKGVKVAVPRPAGGVYRAILLERMQKEVSALVERAPAAAVAEALAKPTAFGSLAATVAASVYGDPAVTDDDRVMLAARAAGAGYKHDLLKRANGAYTGVQLAAALEVTRQAIHEGRSRNRYFAVPTADGLVYPKLQLTKDGILPGLREFLDAFDVQDPWTQLMVLIEPSERLGGRSPLEALRSDDQEGAVSVAAAYGHHGA